MDAESGQPDAADASFAETADISFDAAASVANGSATNGATRGGAANESAAKDGASKDSVPEGSADGGAQDGPAEDSPDSGSALSSSADSSGADSSGADSGGADSSGADDEDSADSGDAGSGADGKGKRKRSFWRELFIVVIAALVLTILIKQFVVQVFSIPSGSMQDTLQPGDRILVNRLVYHLRGVSRGDIVVFSGDQSWGPPPPPAPTNPALRAWDGLSNLVGFSAPGTDYVKRVIGLPGDHVQCCDAQGRVTVNGVPLTEGSYLYPGDQPSQMRFNVVVPAGHLWVLGDHRSDSADSRYHAADGYEGAIPEDEVVGRAFLIIWPASRVNDLPIPNTFEQPALTASRAAVDYGPAVGGGSAAAGILVWRRRRLRRSRRGTS